MVYELTISLMRVVRVLPKTYTVFSMCFLVNSVGPMLYEIEIFPHSHQPLESLRH